MRVWITGMDLTLLGELDLLADVRLDRGLTGLFFRFGKLRLHGHVRVGKDRQSWQELECYLFSEMLICVKEKKVPQPSQWEGADPANRKGKCTLKGSILIKKHLNQVEHSPGAYDHPNRRPNAYLSR